MIKLYHYTGARNIDGIKEKGLLNIFGLMFFTTDDVGEPTVSFEPLRQQGRIVVELTDDYMYVNDLLVSDYDLMASYFNPSLIWLISDTSKWYCSDKKVIDKEIISYEVLVNGAWIKH
jgi:hypothetical protein